MPQRCSWRYLVTVLALAVTYCIAGRLGLLLAIPPGYASGIWPPSGIALAGLLVWGYRVWPGIVLGSFLVNIWTTFETASAAPMLTSVALASSIGVGAALQALGGAFLVQRFVGFPHPLTQAKAISTFLFLGGPASCLINATIGVSSLLLSGAIPPAMAFFSWGTWWVGDTIGVLIVTPIVLVWTAEPRQVWRGRQLSMVVPLAVTLTVAIVLFVYASAWDRDRIKLTFERQVERMGQTLRENFDDYLDVLHAIESFYASSSSVERQEFSSFVQRLLARNPGLQALSWSRPVADAQRAVYEADMQQEGYPDFQITEQSAQGQLVRAAQRPEYVVVSYIEPYTHNKNVLGYDVSSAPDRLDALHRARDTGVPQATDRITLIQGGGEPGILIFLPIYHKTLQHDTVEERRRHLQGYTTGVFRLRGLLESSLQDVGWAGVTLQLYSETSPGNERLLYTLGDARPLATESRGNTDTVLPALGLQRSISLERAGQRWTLRFVPTLAYLATQQTWQPWAVLVGGLLFTSLLGGFLLMITGHTAHVEQMVAQRTAELSRTNTLLAGEITERQQAEDSLARQNRMLAEARDQALQATRAKSAFLAAMSHEIRTPMQAILGMADLLEETPLTLLQQDYVARFKKAGEHLLLLINDILDLSKIEAGQLTLEQTPFDLEDLIETVVEFMGVRAHARGLALLCVLDPDMPTHLLGDPQRLRQILVNLLSNAIKFTDTGTVVLRVEHDPTGTHPGRLSCTVQDTGIGIPAAQLETIFERFTQGDTSTTRKYGGTGLGLSISKRLAELMDGRIWVESSVGQGSTFHVIVQCALNPTPPEQTRIAPAFLANRRVLIVDPHTTSRLFLCAMFRDWGACVAEAHGATDALSAWTIAERDAAPYHLVLLDVQRPGQEECALAAQLHQSASGPQVTVLLLASDARPEDIERWQSFERTQVLLKPITSSRLLRALTEAYGPHDAAADAPRTPPAPAETEKGLAILLAEDNEDNQTLIQAYLKTTAHHLTIADNGAEAVQRFKTGYYDLVFMDMHMPIMDGYTATAQIRVWEQASHAPPTLIIALTANALAEDMQRSREAGCDGHLSKPIKKAALLAALADYSTRLSTA